MASQKKKPSGKVTKTGSKISKSAKATPGNTRIDEAKRGAGSKKRAKKKVATKGGDLVDEILPKRIKQRSKLGLVNLHLDKNVRIKVTGQLYGIEHHIRGDGYTADVLLDHYNQRIRVLDFEGKNMRGLIDHIRWLAEKNKFDKIIVMASKQTWQDFLCHGYVLEAYLKYFLKGEDAFVVSKFRSQERLTSSYLSKEILLIEEILQREPKPRVVQKKLPKGFKVRLADFDDVPELINLYKQIFKTYPSPLIYRDYLESVLIKESLFAVCTDANNDIIAAASADLNKANLAAELTDCATSPAARGKGLMTAILAFLEDELRYRKYICSYTMARARSYGMNCVFYDMNYEFMGRLVNNCDIYGAFEDMNIWVKKLDRSKTRQ